MSWSVWCSMIWGDKLLFLVLLIFFELFTFNLCLNLCLSVIVDSPSLMFIYIHFLFNFLRFLLFVLLILVELFTFNVLKKSLKKVVIGIRDLKRDRQHNGQKKKNKRTNNNLQNITQRTKDRAARTLWESPMKLIPTRCVH